MLVDREGVRGLPSRKMLLFCLAIELCSLLHSCDVSVYVCHRSSLFCLVYLCIWHVTKAWMEQLRRKLIIKGKLKEVFKALYRIMHLRCNGSEEDKMNAVLAAIAKLKEDYKDEVQVLEWFQSTWVGKIGVILLFSFL